MVDSPPDLMRVSGLKKCFGGGRGISDVSFSVPAGSITGFIGANGAGKSTTLRCLLGLIRPDAGQVEMHGRSIDASARAEIGFLPEERGLFAHERARDAIAFHGRLKGMRRKAAFSAADALLERVGLAGREKAQIGSLSKGNAQRVQVLCAFVHGPRLLLLDEPLSGLDPIAQADMLSLFADFRKRGGAIFFSTHSMVSAESLCDRVVILASGRTVFEGTLANAAARAPHGAIIVTTDEAGLVQAAAAVGGSARPLSSAMGEAIRWQVILPKHVTHPALIRALAERGVALITFQPIKSDLEGAFWDVAGKAQSQAA